MLSTLVSLHNGVFSAVQNATRGWLLGLAARFVFAAVLALYFWNSAMGKIGSGIFGVFNIQDGAYFSILGEGVMVAYDFDSANIPFYLDIIVYLGTWTEFLLPFLIIVGLFTRIAALGMVGFVLVQSFVDIAVHKVGPETIGMLFDRDSASAIMDQRAFWMFLFLVLIIKGAGAISLDALLSRWWNGKSA